MRPYVPGDQFGAPQSVSARDVVGRLRPFLTPPARLPQGSADGAPELVPGLVAALAVDMGDQLNFLPSTTIAALGGWQVVWDQAVANLRQLPPMAAAKTHATEGRADTAVYELRSATRSARPGSAT
jgi:hypothetical protein